MNKSDEIIDDLYNKYYLSEKDVLRILKILITENNLNDVVENVIVDDHNKHLGTYVIKDKTISINVPYIIDNSHNWMNRYPDQYSERFSIRFANLQILETILHELRHANQIKELNSKENTPIKIIIQESLDIINSSWLIKKAFYSLHKDCILIERDAYISSLIELLNINERLDIISPFEKNEYMNSKLVKLIKNGYSKTNSPSEKFLKLRNRISEYENLNSSTKDYDNITKLSWGLPTPFEEIKSKEKILSKVLQNKENK